MPIRAYLCADGHTFEAHESMDDEPQTCCARLIMEDGTTAPTDATPDRVCLADARRIIPRTSRPIIR